jgi:dipeptidyl aminopeptidase/acylaminoacyl peptidase
MMQYEQMGGPQMRSIILALLLLGLPAAVKAGTEAPDGTLLSSAPCPANPVKSYRDYLAAVRADLAQEAKEARAEGITMPPISEERLLSSLPPRAAVEQRLAYRGFECHAITYASGGLKIAGLLWKPKVTRGQRLPLLIALRGGRSTYGAMEPWRYFGWHDFLKAGYVVLSTQYRGGPGSEGEDGFGSSGDLDDVRNLVPLAASLGYVDTSRVYMHGGSRGGMQAYMLARSRFPVKAMAIRAGLANLRESWKARPLLRSASEMMTDYASDPEAAVDRRSASLWAHEIKVPSIIFHGSDDWRTRVADPLEVSAGLLKSRTPFELHLYQGDTHSMTLNESDMIARTLAFFARHR